MFEKDKVLVGIAPIAWTNDDIPELGRENTFEQCISEAALAGYQGTEVGNKYPKDPETLGHYMEARGLRIASAWFSAYLTTDSYEETEKRFLDHRDFLSRLGAKVIVVSEQGHSIQGQADTPVFDAKYSMNDQEWEQLSTGLERLGQRAAEKGMKLVYHHHMGTVVQTGAEVDRLMAQTDPKWVYLLFDSGHLAYSGEDERKVLRKYIERVAHVHLKDIRPEIVKRVREEHKSFLDGVRMGAFTVPGDGSIAFQPIFEDLEKSGYEGWLLVEAEQDPAVANPFEYALKARKFIRELAGV